MVGEVARGVLGALLAALLATLIAAPEAASTSTIRVLQMNICHSGIAGCYTGDRVVAKAMAVITATGPDVVSVNEACSGDVEPLRSAMGPGHSMFMAAQHRDGTPVLCRNGEQFGNIIMVTSALSGPRHGAGGRYTVQQGNNEERVWACLPGGRLTACTTHLADRRGQTALAQCHELMADAAGYARTAPVVVAGDFNLRFLGNPDVQQCDQPGFYRKGDGALQHVFLTDNLPFVEATQIDMAGTTDHPGWLVTVAI